MVMTNSQTNLSPAVVPADDLQQVSSSVPVTRVAEALDTIYAGFTEPIPASQLNAAVRTRMARTDLCGSGIGEPVGRDTDATLSVEEAREGVLKAALRVLQGERASGHADSAAETEYADDQLALAARDLKEATELAGSKPVGWSR